ncbi:MAG: sialate O-acetylesterase, partial [Planctomycetaceae bacterium]
MMYSPTRVGRLLVLFLLSVAASVPTNAEDKPLKVYVLCGQSNMQGHAHVRTFEHIGMDPKTLPMLDLMQGEDGKPTVCEDVWISSIGSSEKEKFGRLTAGYGATQNGPKIGPEFTFGIYMQKLVNEPILIIKTAWGGKSLHTDFRPPSAGPYVFNENQLQQMKKQGKDLEKEKAKRAEATGHYYRLMVEHVQHVLADVSRVYPNYDKKRGHKLAGFVWFQGWNDMVDRGVYPNRDKPSGYDAYSTVMAHFIRDVRKDLNAPNLPFVIGVMGAGGKIENYTADQQRYTAIHSNFRNAMAAPADLPEFKGNVVALRTAEFWDNELHQLRATDAKLKQTVNAKKKQDKLTAQQAKETLAQLRATKFDERELKILETATSNFEFHYLGSAK